MPFPTPNFQSPSKSLWKTGSFLACLATLVSPLLLGNNPAQADDFYRDSYRWNQQRSYTAPKVIFTLPSQYRSTQSTTIFQNGQVIRVYEDRNSYGNQDRFFPFSNGASVEFSIGNQGEFRQIERYPINTWNQPQWHRPEQSTFRLGYPSRHHRRW